MNVQGEPRRHWEVARKNLWKQLRQQQLNLLRLGEVKIVFNRSHCSILSGLDLYSENITTINISHTFYLLK